MKVRMQWFTTSLYITDATIAKNQQRVYLKNSSSEMSRQCTMEKN